jgi:hypothetical protein
VLLFEKIQEKQGQEKAFWPAPSETRPAGTDIPASITDCPNYLLS